MLTKHISDQVKDLDHKEGVVIAYANNYGNVDSDRQMSMHGSFRKTVKEHYKKIRVFKDHKREIKLGEPMHIDAEDGVGLLTTTKFNMNKEVSRDMFTDIELALELNRDVDMSVGVIPIKTERAEGYEKVHEWKLKEYSFLSSWGANEMSTVQQIKQGKPIEEIIFLIEKAYDLDYSDSRLTEIENILKTLTAAKSTANGADDNHSDPLTELYKLNL